MSGRKLHDRLVAALDDTGLPYTVELGKKHIKVRLDGHLVLVTSRGKKTGDDSSPTQLKNGVAHIRRCVAAIRRGERPRP